MQASQAVLRYRGIEKTEGFSGRAACFDVAAACWAAFLTISWNRRRTSRTSLGVNIDLERRAIITGPSCSMRNAALEGRTVLVIGRAAQGAARHDEGLSFSHAYPPIDVPGRPRMAAIVLTNCSTSSGF